MYRYYSQQTAAGRVSVVGEITDGVLNVAVALCSNKDQFVRKVGRNIAEGRLAKGKIFHSEEVKTDRIKSEDFAELASAISREIFLQSYLGKIELFKKNVKEY